MMWLEVKCVVSKSRTHTSKMAYTKKSRGGTLIIGVGDRAYKVQNLV